MRANKRFLVGRYPPGRFIPFRKPLVVGGGLDRRCDGSSSSSSSFTPTKRWPRGRERKEERMKQHVVALFQFRGNKRRPEFTFGCITSDGKLVSTNRVCLSCCWVDFCLFFLTLSPSSFYPCERKFMPLYTASQHQQPSYPTQPPKPGHLFVQYCGVNL